MRSSSWCTAALLSALVVACTSADGTVRGGETRFDSASPAPLVVPVTEPAFADASPTSWKGIYRDFFGQRSPASCGGNGTCHGDATKPGARVSNFVCADVDGCYQSLRAAIHPDAKISTRPLVADDDIGKAEGAFLFRTIRYRSPDGQISAGLNMPQTPRDFIYTANDVARMTAWINAGAKNE